MNGSRRLPRLLVVAVPVMLAGAPLAHADVYTWTDASGRLNVSNIAPPEGVHVERVVHEDPPKITPSAAAARDAARAAEVQALHERVARLEDEADRARAQAQAPPPVPYRVVAAPPPAVHIAVNVMPPSVPYPAAAAPVAPDCDPLVFGCPPLIYPAGVVVLRAPGFHRFHRFDRFDRFNRFNRFDRFDRFDRFNRFNRFDRFDRFQQPRTIHRMPAMRPLSPAGNLRRR